MTTQRKPQRIPQQRAMPVYLTIEEAAQVLSMAPLTIRRLISNGTIPAYQAGRRLIRIRLEDLESAMRRIPSVDR